jgi:ABC-type Fe3+/spermidine/putrescine transport system ATPase subunit
LLVLDEPLSQLDPALRDQSRELILSMTEKFGTTLVMVTHDSLDAMRLADRLAVLESGKLVQIDSAQAVYSRPRSRSIAEILSPFGVSQIGQVCFRPESGKLIAAQSECEETDIRFEGVVRQLQFLGFARLALLAVVNSGTQQLVKVLDFNQSLQVGDAVGVRVARQDLLPIEGAPVFDRV